MLRLIGRRAMQWQAIQAGTDGAMRRVCVAAAFVAAVFAFGLTASSAEACSGSRQAGSPAVTAQQIECLAAAPTEIVSAALTQAPVKFDRGGSCCGAGCQAHGAACGNACCAGGLAAINLFNSSFFLYADSVCLSPFNQAEPISALPPPDLRPPHILI